MYIFEILPITKNRFAETLTYFYGEKIEQGQIVKIPFRKKDIKGIILDSMTAEEGKAFIKSLPYKLRPISKIENEKIRKAELELLKNTSEYYRSPLPIIQSIIFPEIFYKSLNDDLVYKKDFYKKTIVTGSFEKRISFYKNIIRVSFAKEKSVFISCPTLRDAKNIFENISKGIENKSFILHSSLTQKNIRESLAKIDKNKCSLIIGTPQYVFLARKNLGAIIIESEHKSIYKTKIEPFIDGRIILDRYAKLLEIPIYKGDSFVSLDSQRDLSLKEAQVERLGESKKMPKIIHEKMADKDDAPKRHKKWKVLSDRTMEKIKETLKEDGSIFIYTLRRGLSTMTVCRDCHQTLSCENCGKPLVLLSNRISGERNFVCYGCRSKFPSTTTCKRCDSWNLSPIGIGTDSVAEYLKEELENPKIEIVDSLSYNSPEKASKAIENAISGGKIIIGTEMALQAIKEKVDLSIIASADSLLSMPTFDSDERLMAIIDEITNITKKFFIIQSRIEKEFLILPDDEKRKLSWIKESLSDRKEFMLPPYYVHISIISNIQKINSFAEYLKSKNFDENEISFYFKKGGSLGENEKEIIIAVKRELYEIGQINKSIKELLMMAGRGARVQINKGV